MYVQRGPGTAGNTTSTTSCFMLTYIRIVIISQLFSVVVASQRRRLGLGLGQGQGQSGHIKRVGRPSLGLTLKSLSNSLARLNRLKVLVEVSCICLSLSLSGFFLDLFPVLFQFKCFSMITS